MKLIVGLGNPGRQYQNTRHNVGFRTLELLADEFEIPVTKEKWNAIFGIGEIGEDEVILAKPLTYMNLSGEAVAPMARWYKIESKDLIVVYDEIHLPLGQLRIRTKGSAGGHNGLESVIEHIGTNEFTRVRLGVDEPPPGFEQAAYVLSKFSKKEKDMVDQMIDEAKEAVSMIVQSGITKAMNKYNIRKDKSTGEETDETNL